MGKVKLCACSILTIDIMTNQSSWPRIFMPTHNSSNDFKAFHVIFTSDTALSSVVTSLSDDDPLTLLTGSSTWSRFQKREERSCERSPSQRTNARTPRVRRSSRTHLSRRMGLYWTRMTRRPPPDTMRSRPALSSSMAWVPSTSLSGLTTTICRRQRFTNNSVSSVMAARGRGRLSYWCGNMRVHTHHTHTHTYTGSQSHTDIHTYAHA